MRFPTHADTLDPFHWLRGELDRLFERAAPRPGDAWTPPVMLHETESAFEARLPIAGADAEGLEIHVEGDVLRVSGERAAAPDDDDDTARRELSNERLLGRFRRELRLPAAVDAEQVAAQYHDGVLRITLPKSAEARPRRIQVTA